VLTAVANSGFDTDLASWTDADDAGGPLLVFFFSDPLLLLFVAFFRFIL
jgi:hypothetical protein